MSQESKRIEEIKNIYFEKFGRVPDEKFIEICREFDKTKCITDVSDIIGEPLVECSSWRRSDDGREGRSFCIIKEMKSSVWHRNSVFATIPGRVPISKENSDRPFDGHFVIM